eukprot:1189593-Prorocentrum_minimum.AAC.2
MGGDFYYTWGERARTRSLARAATGESSIATSTRYTADTASLRTFGRVSLVRATSSPYTAAACSHCHQETAKKGSKHIQLQMTINSFRRMR